MADVSAIVPNKAFIDFAPSVVSIEDDSPNAELIRGIEAMIFAELGVEGISLNADTYEDEEINVELKDLFWDELLVRSQQKFALKHRPVITFTTLKIVESRKVSDGTPEIVSVVPRNTYHVDEQGIVTLLQASQPFFQQGQLYQSVMYGYLTWPKGKAVMLATYDAGIDFLTNPPQSDQRTRILRLLMLQMFSRLHQMQKQDLWYQTGVSGDMGTINLLRTDFSAEEKGLLRAFVKLS